MSTIAAPAADSDLLQARKWWPQRSRSVGNLRFGDGGITAMTRGRAGQQQARSARRVARQSMRCEWAWRGTSDP